MPIDYVQLHHADYLEDIPFWLSVTEDLDPVLEIGCGHGRAAIPLLKAGRRMIGIDLDPHALDTFKRVLREDFPQLVERAELVNGDVLTFDPSGPIGAVIIPCNTFSTFRSRERPDLLRKVHSWLLPGGIFSASLPNPANLISLHSELIDAGEMDPEFECSLRHPGTGNPIQVSSRFRALEDRLGWDWIYDHLLPDGNVERLIRSAEHDLAGVDQYLGEAQNAGFGSVEYYGDFDQSEYDPDSPYLILICKV